MSHADAEPRTDNTVSTSASRGSSSSVAEYLEADHRRLDAILDDAAKLAGSDTEAAARRFQEFSRGLSRHIDIEEQIVFVAFERATGNDRGPTRVMRLEHVEIRRCMDAAAAALERGDREGFESARQALTALLSQHNMKEERVLYPMTDHSLGENQRAELVRRMQAYPG